MEKKIVLTIEEMKHLEKLGLDTSDASMYAGQIQCGNEWLDIVQTHNDYTLYPAYTLQDILEKIPNYKIIKSPNEWADSISLEVRFDDSHIHKLITSNSEIECAYQMLLWCIENNYIKTNKQ